MNCRHRWFTAALAAFLLIGVILIHSFTTSPVLASTGDDVRTLTQIVTNENRITGVNPESIALAESMLADTVTLVTPTGLVKHVQKDKILTILTHLRRETGDARLSIEVSDVQVHLYGDTAIVTYQKQIKRFESSEGTSVPGLTDHPMSLMDTFVKRDGQWKAVATVGVSQSPLPDELYKAMKTEAAQW